MSGVGYTLGGYRIEEEVGQGKAARVYRAYQAQLDRWVALKVLKTSNASDQEFLARFRREARAIAALRHPNILTIYDYGEEGGYAYIVMEHVPGGPLRVRLTGQPLEWPDAATLVIPVGRALAYAHSRGIVHRDVKPENILLANADWPLLADFGLVKVVGGSGTITQPGVSIGTPTYFSPEQAAGDEVDHRSDIYSLGILLYEVLTGHLPFEGGTPFEAMIRRLSEPPVPPRHLNPLITPPLQDITLRALAREPEARYPTMKAMVDELAKQPGATGRVAAQPTSTSWSADTTTRISEFSAVTGPHLIVVSTETTVRLPYPQKSEIYIGRVHPHTIPLPDVDLGPYGGSSAGVSRRHARLTHDPPGWLLEDLGSTNGTFLNGVRVHPGQPVCVQSGDSIRCGQLMLVFYEE